LWKKAFGRNYESSVIPGNRRSSDDSCRISSATTKKYSRGVRSKERMREVAERRLQHTLVASPNTEAGSFIRDMQRGKVHPSRPLDRGGGTKKRDEGRSDWGGCKGVEAEVMVAKGYGCKRRKKR